MSASAPASSETTSAAVPALRPDRANLLYAAAAFVIVIAGLKAAQELVLLVLAAVFVAVAIAPPIFYLVRKGVPFLLGLGLVMSALVGILGFMAGVLGSSINDFRGQLPFYQERFSQSFLDVDAYLNGLGFDFDFRQIGTDLVDPAQALDLAGTFFAGVGGVLANGFLIFIMVVFLLLEASTFPAKLQAAFGDRGASLAQFHELGASINRYLVIKTWVSLLTGFLAGLLCAIVGVDFPLLWGLLAFLLNYVPNIGSILAAVPPALLALIQLGLIPSLVILIGYMVLNNVLGNFVEPRFMGQGLGLSTFAVVLSLVFWGWVLGPVGMLLSIPLTMAVKIAMQGNDETSWASVLLGSGADAEKALAAAKADAADA